MNKFYLFLLPLLFVACQPQQRRVTNAQEQTIPVDARMDEHQDTDYLQTLAPIKEQLNEQLDIVIGNAPEPLTVGQIECSMLNFASDALQDMAKQVAQQQPDFAIVNRGGMRCEWAAGDITIRSVYELMPFDNKLVILTLQGQDIIDLCNIFATQNGQGLSRELRMKIADKGGKPVATDILLNGKPILPEAVYYVATSDYLSGGNDHMYPLADYSAIENTDLLIRELYIEYVKQLTAKRLPVKGYMDGRITKL